MAGTGVRVPLLPRAEVLAFSADGATPGILLSSDAEGIAVGAVAFTTGATSED